MYVGWVGPSRFDGVEIMLVAAAVDRPSSNRKTGAMVQVYILPRAEEPSLSLWSGGDRSVCGDCDHRPSRGGSCYVQAQSPTSGIGTVWRKARSLDADLPRLLAAVEEAGRPVRLGAWGDPGAVPVSVLRAVVEPAPGWTGYTHAWRDLPRAYADLLMASVDSPQERRAAKAAGWRTFRTRLPAERLDAGEVPCLATEAHRGRKLTCEDCRICDGLGGRGRKDVSLPVHGTSIAVRRYGVWRRHGVPTRRRDVQLPLWEGIGA